MRRVDSAVIRPHHCAVYPQLGASPAEGLFDAGNDLAGFDNHIYVSVAAVKEMARDLGYVPPADHRVVENQRDAALGRIASLEQELADKQKALDSIDFLGSHDFIARKKRGPKPQAERTAA